MATLDQAIEQRQAPYFSAFTRVEADLVGLGPHWFRDIRRAAMDSFIELGFPTTRNEEWKFTNLAGLTSIPFEWAQREHDALHAEELIKDLPRGHNRVVFVNGFYTPKLSSPGAENAIVGSLREAFARGTPDLERHLARYADYRGHAFVALNTAFLADGGLVYVPAGTVVEEPIHIIHIATGGSHPQVSYPRNLVVLEAGSQASLIETYIGPAAPSNPYFTNAVTEIVGGQDAILDHYKLQMESDAAFHIATVQMVQGRGCAIRSHSFALGAALARTETNTTLSEGSDSTLNGLYLAGGTQHVDTRTSIDHAQPHGTSHEVYKGVLDGRSSAVFNGRIIVRKDAQKTDAKQTNRNLVLSEGSTINTKPELQIHADDVRCTHGATIGQLDKDSVFYLRSRGIGNEQAREILIAAFAREIIDAVQVESLRNYIENMLVSRLARKVK